MLLTVFTADAFFRSVQFIQMRKLLFYEGL